MNQQKLGSKIVVVGISASGKTTFAKHLSSVVDLPVFYIDEIMWNPDWEYIGDKETIKKLIEISSQDKWIVEGYVEKEARAFVFNRADTIIYLDYSRILSSWQYIKRWWKHRKNPRPELPGSPESFSFKFLKLVWTKGEAITLNKSLLEYKNNEKLIVLTSPKEAKELLKSFKK